MLIITFSIKLTNLASLFDYEYSNKTDTKAVGEPRSTVQLISFVLAKRHLFVSLNHKWSEVATVFID